MKWVIISGGVPQAGCTLKLTKGQPSGGAPPLGLRARQRRDHRQPDRPQGPAAEIRGERFAGIHWALTRRLAFQTKENLTNPAAWLTNPRKTVFQVQQGGSISGHPAHGMANVRRQAARQDAAENRNGFDCLRISKPCRSNASGNTSRTSSGAEPRPNLRVFGRLSHGLTGRFRAGFAPPAPGRIRRLAELRLQAPARADRRHAPPGSRRSQSWAPVPRCCLSSHHCRDRR